MENDQNNKEDANSTISKKEFATEQKSIIRVESASVSILVSHGFKSFLNNAYPE